MRQRITIPAAALLVASVAACSRGGERRAAETAQSAPAAVAAPAPESGAAGGGLTRREEAQDHFDQARQAFERKDMPTTARELRAGAAFLSQRVDSATGDARTTMQAAAGELDALARSADSGRVVAVKNLDDAFARANLAEAMRHQAAAIARWASKDAARTGAELTMASDHLERAAQDAGMALQSGSTRALADARAVAGKLLQGTTVPPADVERATRALGGAVDTVRGKLLRVQK